MDPEIVLAIIRLFFYDVASVRGQFSSEIMLNHPLYLGFFKKEPWKTKLYQVPRAMIELVFTVVVKSKSLLESALAA